jgi:probable HAF family extracellular repeat protein
MRNLSRQSFCAVAFVLGCLGATAAQASGYAIADLGKNIYPNQINEQGQIAATSARSGVFPMVFRDGRLHRLCCDGGPGVTYAQAINGHGDVVGQGGDLAEAIMWKRGGTRLVLPLPEGLEAVDAVNGVTIDGTTVGTYLPYGRRLHCFRTSPTGPAQNLGLMGDGDYCQASAINRSGQIVGGATTTRSGPLHAFLWIDGVFQDLGAEPGYTVATALNDHGDVVGVSPLGGFLWSHGQLQYLGSGNPLSINNSGVIVGEGTGAVRFDASGPTPLVNEVVNLDGWLSLDSATSVNDLGVIIGWGVGDDGHRHGFMLVPLPDQ